MPSVNTVKSWKFERLGFKLKEFEVRICSEE